MKFIAFMLSFMACSLYALSSSLGPWQFQEVQKTTIGANKLLVPLVVLSRAVNSQQENKIAAAKDIGAPGEKIFLVVRLQQKKESDVPVMIEAGVGITIPRSSFLAAQSIWPDEKISAIDDEEFMRIIENANIVSALINKDGSEPTNIFNGSGHFDFAKDREVLSRSENWRALRSERLEKAHHQIPPLQSLSTCPRASAINILKAIMETRRYLPSSLKAALFPSLLPAMAIATKSNKFATCTQNSFALLLT